MSFNCQKCGAPASLRNLRFFVVPGHIMVPNSYLLCDEHRGFRYNFEDIYNEDGTRKKPNDKEKLDDKKVNPKIYLLVDNT